MPELEHCFGEVNAVVVAHPDDEVLWAGGFLARHRKWRWDVLCCSIPRIDPERAWRFVAACRTLGADPLLLPYIESPPDAPLRHLELLEGLRDYDCSLWAPRPARIYPARLGGLAVWALRFEGERYPSTFVELVSGIPLKATLGVEDGDIVAVVRDQPGDVEIG